MGEESEAFEIYDVSDANLVRSFPTEEAALEMVRSVIKKYGWEAVEWWELGRTDLTGELYAGKDLAIRAMAGSR